MPTDVPPAPQESAWASRPAAAARGGLLALLVLVPLAVAVGALVRGSEGALGALLGGLVPALVLVVTYAAVQVGRRRGATAFAGLLMGSYLLKLVGVGVLLAVLRGVDDADRTVLGLTAVLGLLLAVAVEALVVTRSRVPYVEP